MTFEYKVVYSARKTVCLKITSENELTICCPYGYTKQKIQELLRKKSSWISKHFFANSAKREFNNDILTHETIMVKGGKLPLVICDKNLISTNAVCVKDIKHVKKLYCEAFSAEFAARVETLCSLTGLTAASVKFRNYKSRWGCCDAHNNVVFNYKLFMLDVGLWDYVIIHELCHTRYHNHSQAFWRLVESYLPDYKQRRKLLKSFDFITSLY